MRFDSPSPHGSTGAINTAQVNGRAPHRLDLRTGDGDARLGTVGAVHHCNGKPDGKSNGKPDGKPDGKSIGRLRVVYCH